MSNRNDSSRLPIVMRRIMARRIKADKFDVGVEAALEDAIDYGGDALPSHSVDEDNNSEKKASSRSNKLSGADEGEGSELFDLEDLEQQMALAAEEMVADEHGADFVGEKTNVANGRSRSIPRVGNLSKNNSGKDFSFDSDSQGLEFSNAAQSIYGVDGSASAAINGDSRRSQVRNDLASGRAGSLEYSSALSQTDVEDGYAFQENYNIETINDVNNLAAHAQRKLKFASMFWGTVVVSVFWALGGFVTLYNLSSDTSMGNFLMTGAGLLVAIGTVVPILMFFGFAQLAHRARDLQSAVEEINIAARRLLEPETESKERIQNLGLSIRQEVDAMGDGIDRTISRAGELEALLQSEVNNLEQAYSENEKRIRSLIVELANERVAVSTHAEHVKTTITGAKDQLTREFNSIADHINASAESFTSTLSDTLNVRWGELVEEFNAANEGVAQQLSHKFIETVQSFDASRGRFFEELDTRFKQIDQHTEEASNAVAERLGSKMDDFVQIVHDRTEDVEVRFNSLTGRLASSGEKIIEAVNDSVSDIEKRSVDIDTRLRSTANKVLNDFQGKFDGLDEAIETRGEKSLNAFSQQIARLENRVKDLPLTLDTLAVSSVDQFAQQITKVEEQFALLSGRLVKNGSNITDAISSSLSEIEERSDDIDARIKISTERLVSEFDDKFGYVDETIHQRTKSSLRQFADQILILEKQAGDLSFSFDTATNLAIQAFEKRLDQVDESLNDRSTSLIRSFIARTEALEESTDKLNVALDTHVGRINDAFQQRTHDIAQTLTGGRDGILSVVEETKVRLSHEMEIVGLTIANLVDERAGGFIHQFTEGREKLSNTLEKEAAQIVTTISTQLGLLSRHVGEIEEKLINNIQSVDKKTAAHSQEFLARSAQFERTITNSFDVAREVIEVQTKNLDTRSLALSDSLKLNSESLKAILGEQAGAIEARIAHIRDMIAQGNVSFTDALGQHVDLIQSAISTNDDTLKNTFMVQLERLESQTSRLKDVFSENHVNLAQTIDGHILDVKETFSSSESAMSDALSAGQKDIKNVLAGGHHGLKEILSGNQAMLQDTLNSSQASFNNIMYNGQSNLNSAFEKNHDIIEERLQSYSNNIANQTNQLKDSIGGIMETVDERMELQGKQLDQRALSLREVVEHNSDLLDKAFQAQTAIIDERSSTMQNALEIGVTNVRTVLEQNALSLSEILRERVSEVSSTLKIEAELAEVQISKAGEKLNEIVLESVHEVEKKLQERAVSLKENVSDIGSQLDVGFTAIENRISSTAISLNSEAEKAHNIIMSAGQRLAGSVVESAQNVDDQFNVRDQILKSNMQEIEGQIHAGLDLISQEMAGAVANLSDEASRAENMLANAGERLSGSVVQAAQSVEEKLADRSVFLKENILLIEERVTTGLSSIEGRISEITQKTATQLVSKTQDLHGLTELLQTAATKTSDSLGILTNQFSDQLKEVTRAAEERLRSENNTFINNFSNSSDETVAAVKAIKSDISESIAQLLDRLDTSNGTIQQTVNALRNGVYEVDNRLNDVTNEFQQNIGQLSESFAITSNNLNNDLDRFSGLSQITLDGVAKFSQQFNDHAKILTDATGLLERSHDVFNERLDERQVVLSSLANGLVQKSEEVSETMQNCEQVIAAIMRQTEERTRTSSVQLQSSLSDMVNDASSRFEGATSEIRKSAEEIREELARTRADLSRGVRTLPTQTKEYTEAMRKAVVEQIEALKELSGIVEESGRVFDVSTPTAAPVNQANLFVSEQTKKTNLADSVRSFAPQEQKATVLQSDLVSVGAGGDGVAHDPLPASLPTIGQAQFAPPPLNNRIVQNSNSIPLPASFLSGSSVSSLNDLGRSSGDISRSFGDFVRPVDDLARPTSEPSRAVPRNLSGTTYQTSPSFKPSASMQNGAAQAKPVQAHMPSFTSSLNGQQPLQNRGIDNTSNSSEVKSAPPPPRAQSRGWVSDLLARASRDDADKAPAQNATNFVNAVSENASDTLTSMSTDIVQGIDLNAIAELWQYYRRGQRNITPNRLYNASGLKIFEKLKHKYALEGEFRRAVSQYITDFERLLGDVTKNGGNNDAVREYLTSDTGKVYTMLAHASGRIQ